MIILRVIFLAIIALLFCSPPTYADPSFSKVIVFGDSNVDSGETQEGSLYNLSGGNLNGPPNVGGRSCNGPVVVEYVAQMLGIPLIDYGVAGATTGETNIAGIFYPQYPAILNTGVLVQIETFKESLGKKKADSRALYIYWAGSNDLFQATAADLLPRIDAALVNIETALTTLTKLGARYILVATRPIRRVYYDVDNTNGVIFNARLRILVQDLNEKFKANILIFEAFDLVTEMTYNPTPYGFLNTTDLCSTVSGCFDDPTGATSDTYITWDNAHKTTRVHEIMAEELVIQSLNMIKGEGWGEHWDKN